MKLFEVEPITRFGGPHRWLSNFAESPIIVSGPWWASEVTDHFPTVEHAYQAAKVEPGAPHFAEHYGRIASAPGPAQAKMLGSARGFARADATIRPHWDEDKPLVMLACLREKFSAGSELAGRLVDTGTVALVEGNTWGDMYWGVDAATGEGANVLGRLLMVARAELAAASAAGVDVGDLRWVVRNPRR